jgi:hypothetical protein
VGGLTYTPHPLGFVRGESITAEGRIVRTHYWPETEVAFKDSDLHQHGDDFDSEVLAGEIAERLFAPRPDPNGNYELWRVVCYSDPDGTYHVDLDPSHHVTMVTPVLTDEYRYRAGDIYHRPRTDYHQVQVVNAPVVTMSVWGPQARTRPHYFMRSIKHPKSMHQQRLGNPA